MISSVAGFVIRHLQILPRFLPHVCFLSDTESNYVVGGAPPKSPPKKKIEFFLKKFIKEKIFLRVILKLRIRFQLHLFVWGLSAPQMEIMKALLLTQFSPLPPINYRALVSGNKNRNRAQCTTHPYHPISSSLLYCCVCFQLS
jgi:hypothetical protein